jgi:hypothetical protein
MTFDLIVREGEQLKVIDGNRIIAYFNGEVALYNKCGAVRRYINLCKQPKTNHPER